MKSKKFLALSATFVIATVLATTTLSSCSTPVDTRDPGIVEIYNTYVPMGFSYFKIEGRTWSDIELACTYAYYMVKPEYHLFFISTIMNG